MISKCIVNQVRENWEKAALALGFKIEIPFPFLLDEIEKSTFAFLEEFGSPKGMVIGLIEPPDFKTNQELIRWAEVNECYCSFINPYSYTSYNIDDILECLNDWGRYTPGRSTKEMSIL